MTTLRRGVAFWLATLVWLPLAASAQASPAESDASEDRLLDRTVYDRAAQMLKMQEWVYNESLTPVFIGSSDDFWYRSDDRDGARFWRVDPLARTNQKRPAFDHERLAGSLSALTDRPMDPLALPFDQIDLSETGRVKFEIVEAASKQGFDCSLSGADCRREAPAADAATDPAEEPAPPAPAELLSPDGSLALIVRDHDLYLVDKKSGDERRLTSDGESHYDYGSQPESRTTAVTEKLLGFQSPPSAVFSPDGRWILTYRLDQRDVLPMYVIQTTNLGDSHRPVLHEFRFPVPGDESVAESELVVIDTRSGKVTPIETDVAHTPYRSLVDFGQLWIGTDPEKGYLLRRPRGARAMSLEEIELSSGEARTLVSETSEHLVEPNLLIAARPNVRVLEDGGIIWFSQRDGWAHLYLYGANGTLARQITRGSWVVRDILFVDEERDRVFFTATGVDPDDDPYLRKLYVTSIRGGDETSAAQPRLLTPESGDHSIVASPTGRTFVDVYSGIRQPTRARVIDANGTVLVELEEADFSRLTDLGVELPTPFTVKARDGKTDLYGTIIFPPGFADSDRDTRYPVIDGVYPGPQATRVARNLHDPMVFVAQDMALAQLGFVVVSVDGFGTPFRSKSFHVRSAGQLQEAGGLADHVATFRQLGARYPKLDLDRVGIYGHSGGGFASARAMLAYPELYKVAVSSAGNHDQRGYLQLWGEHYHGDPEEVSYEEQSNASIAHRLEGKLLLAYGAMDDNVNQALTLQLIDALTKANKDYDLLVLPAANHGFATDPYFVRRLWDYFVEHLAGKEPPEFDLGEALR